MSAVLLEDLVLLDDAVLLEDREPRSEDRGQETGHREQQPEDRGPIEAARSESGDESPHSKVPRRKRQACPPNDDDHAIYRLVKLDCKSQLYVADLFGISQPTVSRIVERYEKWQAHAEARASGQLDPAERVRAQRALNYLRNEKIITSCLRLADDVEGFQELSSSTSAAPGGGLAGMREIRVMNRVLDRTGMASRFYRLAHRVGLDQLALVEREPAIAPAPLSESDEAEQEVQAAADRAEIQAARDRRDEQAKAWEASLGDRIQRAEQEAAKAREEADKLQQELAGVLALLAETQQELGQAQRVAEGETKPEPEAKSQESEVMIRADAEGAVVELNLNNLNSVRAAKNGAIESGESVCDTNRPETENRAKLNNGRTSSGGEKPPSKLPREWMTFTPERASGARLVKDGG